jgi:hypothetical protein
MAPRSTQCFGCSRFVGRVPGLTAANTDGHIAAECPNAKLVLDWCRQHNAQPPRFGNNRPPASVAALAAPLSLEDEGALYALSLADRRN